MRFHDEASAAGAVLTVAMVVGSVRGLHAVSSPSPDDILEQCRANGFCLFEVRSGDGSRRMVRVSASSPLSTTLQSSDTWHVIDLFFIKKHSFICFRDSKITSKGLSLIFCKQGIDFLFSC